MSDLQITDDMKMENFNEFMRMLRKNARYTMDIGVDLENASKTARIALEEKTILNNYVAFLYNNNLIANREDVYDTLKQFLDHENSDQFLSVCDTQHLDKFKEEHYEQNKQDE